MIIEVEALEIDYGTGKDAFKVLDIPRWQVAEADKVAIFGPSGSGKSTLLHALAGLLLPSRGRLTVFDHSLGEMTEAQRDAFRARHIGYIFQNFNLLQGFSALENVLLGMAFAPCRVDVEAAEHLLDEVGLSHRLRHRPAQMSAGEQQRVAVARALANRPKLLLADEPTASLHPVNKEDVLRMLLDMCDRYGCTLVLVTHEREVLSLFAQTVTFLELNRAYQQPLRGRS